MATQGVIRVTAHDYQRLRHLVGIIRQSHGALPGVDRLDEILDLARVVRPERVPRDVVTMNSRVVYEDVATQRTETVSVVYPAQADPSNGKISILSPVGAALLGESEEEEVELTLPQGRTRRIRIINVLYQPEARGDFAL